MTKAIQRRLQDIEHLYYEGATYETLCERIEETARLICSLNDRHPWREACEVFAPSLWGGTSGSAMDPDAVKAALEGPDGSFYLRSWSGIGRALMAYRLAA